MLRMQIRWLQRLIARPDAQAALALVPDSVPKDAASWLTFCVHSGRAGECLAFRSGSADMSCRSSAPELVSSAHGSRQGTQSYQTHRTLTHKPHRADLVSASDVGGLVGGITAALECRHIASPLVADKMVALLTAMLKAERHRVGPTVSAASSRALRLAVLGEPCP